MATIGTTIELTDRMTAPLHNILNALNLTISSFQDMQSTAAQDIDTSSIEAAREQINQATAALNEFEASGRSIPVNTPPVIEPQVEPIVPDPLIDTPAPVEVPVSWQSNGMDIFTNSGIERFESEIQSANTMLNTLHTTQEQIASTAAQTDIFPDNMAADLNSVNGRIQRIQSIIQQIERNPINRLTSSTVNNDIERLRSRLNQAVQEQRQLNQAMDEMDISSANAAYDQLQSTISETEMYLRDNVDEQGQFNQQVQAGEKHADKLMSTVKKIAAAYLSFQTLMKAIDLSDTLALSESRLSLIVDDGGSVDELEKKIFASAQRSRAAYQDTIDIVSKLGLLAGKAFSGNDEMIAFTELMNKNFIVGGASATEQASAMYQLTQAMASGRLQGDEYRSIIENAPLLAKAIEDYMVNVKGAEGTMKDWASEGLLTADVIKAALFSSADEIEQRFNDMPMTFGQIWTSIKNNALQQFQPILKKMNEIANSDKFEHLVDNVTRALAVVAGVCVEIFDAVASVGNFIADNWSTIEPIIWGVVTAMAAWKLITTLNSIATGIAAAAEAGYTGVKGIAIGVTAGLTGATVAATAAQWGMNGALQACPLVWILDIIILVIAAVIALAVVFAIFTEQIVGAIWWLGALFKNVGLWIANVALGIWNSIKNIGLWFANLGLSIWTVIKNIGLWFGNLGQAIWAVIQNVGFWFANLFLGLVATVKAVATNIGIAFSNGWITVQVGFWSMVNVIMQGLKSIAETANSVLGWMGVNIDTSGLDFAANKIDELNAKKQDYVDVGAAWSDANSTYAYKDVGDAFGTYDYGSVADAWNTNDIDWGKGWSDGYNTFDTFQEGWGSDAYAAGAEVGAGIHDWIDENLSIDGLLDKFGGSDAASNAYDAADFDTSQYLSDIADDTGSIKDSVDLSEEDLKYLRDIAERDVINRFTTAEVKVEFGGITNNVSSETDLDGMVTYISDRVAEELEVVAEGVHE